MLDTSASMGYSSHGITKLDYARFLAASLAYLANQQRDAAGVIVFDDDVRNYVQPSTRQGQFMRVAHAIEHAADRHAHRFRQAVHAFSAVPAPARHRGGDLRFLRAARRQ